MNTVTPENVVLRINATEPENRKKPVEHLIAELRQIAAAFTTETEYFVAKGVPQKFCQTAIVLADEVEIRETAWSNSRGGTSKQKAAWKIAYPEIADIREFVLDSLETVLVDNDDAMRMLERIDEGEGPEETLLDVSKLVDVAKLFPVEAMAAGFSEDRIDELAIQGKEYAAIYAKTLALPGGSTPAKTARDRARTFAEKYLSRVRFHADRVFRKDKEKRAMFTSKYETKMSAEYRARQKAKREAKRVAENP